MCPYLPHAKTSVIYRIKFINILSIALVRWLVFVLVVLHFNCVFMGILMDVPSFADAHLETLKNSLEFKVKVMMFLARQSY